MTQDRTGCVEVYRRANGRVYYRAKIRLADKSRARVDVPSKYSYSRERAELYAEAVQEREDQTGELLAKKRARLVRGTKTRALPEMAAWLEAWLASRTAKGQTATRENSSHYEQHIARVIGPQHVREWSTDDLRRLSRYLDERIQAGDLAWKTAGNVWTTAGAMLGAAVRSKRDDLRCRDSNPIRDVEGPSRGVERSHTYLYPSEVLAFVACADVPLRWRRAVALAVYTFARVSELRVLTPSDFDLEHGTIHVHRARDRITGNAKSTKTKHARRFALEPAIVPLIDAMCAEAEERGKSDTDPLIEMTSDRDLSRGLKRWLRKAGIDREELYTSDATRQALRFHDLRATGITWMAVRGDAPQLIQTRAGHSDYSTTLRYIRAAEAVRDGFGDVFPGLPELTEESARSKHRSKFQNLVPNSMILQRGGRDSKRWPFYKTSRFEHTKRSLRRHRRTVADRGHSHRDRSGSGAHAVHVVR